MATLQDLITEARDELDEAAPKRTKRRVAGKGTRKTTKKCPPGQHMKGGRCVRVPTAQRRAAARRKKKWAKTGAGKKSAKRSARFKKRWS